MTREAQTPQRANVSQHLPPGCYAFLLASFNFFRSLNALVDCSAHVCVIAFIRTGVCLHGACCSARSNSMNLACHSHLLSRSFLIRYLFSFCKFK